MEEIEKEKLSEIEFKLNIKENKKEKQKLVFLLSFIILLIGGFMLINPDLFTNSYYTSSSARTEQYNNIKLFSSFLILLSTVGFAYLFMSGFNIKKIHELNSKNEEITTEDKNDEYLQFISILKSLDKSIEKGRLESVLSIKEREDIISQISSTINNQLNESLIDKIEEKYGQKIYNEKLSVKANDLLSKTVNRLVSELEKLQSKATVNLVYGILSTIVAIFILIIFLFNGEAPKDISQIATVFYYMSRFFLVLLVQGIAIFFLRLYKATLNDIMYLNNEITNYEAKRDALALSYHNNQPKAVMKILSSLSDTERNFILKKDESSIFNQSKDTKSELVNINILKEVLSKIDKTK